MECRRVGDARELELHGVVDASQARTLHQIALSCLESPLHVRVNCAGLERVDTAAVQVLVALDRALRERGVALTLSRPPASLLGYLRQCGADGLLGAGETSSGVARRAASVGTLANGEDGT